MKKLFLCVVAIIVGSLAIMYRPVKGQNQMSLNYATMSSISYSYSKDRTGQKLLEAVKQNTEENKVEKNENADKIEQNAGNMIIPEGSNAIVETAIKFAQSKIGCPYVFGGKGEPYSKELCYQKKAQFPGGRNGWTAFSNPEQYIGKESYDCSGLLTAAYTHAGVNLSGSTYTLMATGKEVDANDPSKWKRGDLIFPKPTHVVMYLGDGKVIHAPQSGDVVKESNLYWLNNGTYAVRRYVY